MRQGKLRVLVVGQTPPPFGGQAAAIQSFLDGDYDRLELRHVRMAFSRDMGEVGRFQLRKVLQLPLLIARILWARVRWKAEVLYYPPAASARAALLRDIVVLTCCRWAFRRTVFHFQAGGLAEQYPTLGSLLRSAFMAAYGQPDVAVSLAEHGLADGALLRARHQAVVPNGVADEAGSRLGSRHRSEAQQLPVALFVGVLRESKGVVVLVDALARLKAQGAECDLRLVGEFQPPSFEGQLRAQVADLGLGDRVTFLGRRLGEAKWEQFLQADMFCFPTFFEYESFPLVLLEAMQFELPVVATHWRGVPAIVDDGVTGFLVEVGDAEAVADRMALLVADSSERWAMGRAGRQRYLAAFTEDHYRRGLEMAIELVDEDDSV